MHWKTAGALKRTTAFRALEESNKQSLIVIFGLIGPSGLLLVVCYYLQSQFQFQWWGWKKVSKGNLDVRHIFAGSHTQHWWICSYAFELWTIS
jgi:hypothetical protein